MGTCVARQGQTYAVCEAMERDAGSWVKRTMVRGVPQVRPGQREDARGVHADASRAIELSRRGPVRARARAGAPDNGNLIRTDIIMVFAFDLYCPRTEGGPDRRRLFLRSHSTRYSDGFIIGAVCFIFYLASILSAVRYINGLFY